MIKRTAEARALEITPYSLWLVVVAIGLCWLAIQLLPVLLVLIVALFLVGTLNPLVAWAMRRGLGRGWSIGLVFGLLFLAVLGLGVITVPALIDQLRALVEQEPELRRKLAHFLAGHRLTSNLAESIRGVHYDQLARQAAGNVLELTTRVVAVIAYFVSAVFLALYVMIDRDRLRGGLFALTPRAQHIRLSRILLNLERIVGGYIRGQAFTSALMSVFVFVLLVACGVPGALGLAVLAGATDVLPYIGAVLSVGPAALAALSQGPVTVAVVVAVLVAYQEFESRFIIPRVYGHTLRLPSAVVLLAVLAGGVLMGIIGALLALPIAAALVMLVDELRIDLPGEAVDAGLQARDEAAERNYERLAEGVPAEQAAAIALELSAERQRFESESD